MSQSPACERLPRKRSYASFVFFVFFQRYLTYFSASPRLGGDFAHIRHGPAWISEKIFQDSAPVGEYIPGPPCTPHAPREGGGAGPPCTPHAPREAVGHAYREAVRHAERDEYAV